MANNLSLISLSPDICLLPVEELLMTADISGKNGRSSSPVSLSSV